MLAAIPVAAKRKAWKARQDAETATGDAQAPQSDAARERRAVKERQRNRGIAARRCQELEGRIETVEDRVAAIDREMAANPSAFERLTALTAERDALSASLPALYAQWEQAQDALAAFTGEGEDV